MIQFDAVMRALDKAGSAFLRAILRRMKELGVSQTELAKRMDASRPYVTKVLGGDVNITFGTAARFAKALQMDFLPTLAPQEESGLENGESRLGCMPMGEQV